MPLVSTIIAVIKFVLKLIKFLFDSFICSINTLYSYISGCQSIKSIKQKKKLPADFCTACMPDSEQIERLEPMAR